MKPKTNLVNQTFTVKPRPSRGSEVQRTGELFYPKDDSPDESRRRKRLAEESEASSVNGKASAAEEAVSAAPSKT